MCSCKFLLSPTDVKLGAKFKRNLKSNLVNFVNIMILKIPKYFFFFFLSLVAPLVDGEDVKEKEIQVMIRLRHKICFWEKKALILQTVCLEKEKI